MEYTQRSLRRALYLRTRRISAVRRLGGRLPDDGDEPESDPARDYGTAAAFRRDERSRVRRSGAVQVPDRVLVRAGLLVSKRDRSPRTAGVFAEGGLPDRRRLSFPRRVAGIRTGDPARDSHGANRPSGALASDFQQLLHPQITAPAVSGPAPRTGTDGGVSRDSPK